ncbi:MAG TPA: hypothetical protein VEL74_05830, partial [Thermoanaerobaculia bacterium]|nr:hypothetical protein [Thermoanaerobaculia bacterium]
MRFQRLLALLLLTAVALPGLPARGATPSAPFLLDEEPRCTETAPDVAFLPGGGFAAVWGGSRPQPLLASPAVYLRLFDRDGRPLGPETLLTSETEQPARPAVAANAGGTFLVVWGDSRGEGTVQGRLFNASGSSLGEAFEISARSPRGGVDVTAEPGGGFAVVWANKDSILLRRYGPTGEALDAEQWLLGFAGVPEDTFPQGYDPAVVAHGPAGLAVAFSDAAARSFSDPTLRGGNLGLMLVKPGQEPPYIHIGTFGLDPVPVPQRLPRPSLAVGAAGRVFVVWREQTPEGLVLRGRIYTALGDPLGDAFRLDLGAWDELSGPSVATDGSGNFLLAWLGAPTGAQPEGARVYVRRFGADGNPLGGQEPVSSLFPSFDTTTSPALTVDPMGRALIAWGTGRPLPPIVGAPFQCFSEGIYGQILDPATPLDLPLQGGRFLAGVRWADHAGRTGVGQPVALTGDSGYFWFFDENNAELVVKVLDGRAVNGHYWVFYGALSD